MHVTINETRRHIACVCTDELVIARDALDKHSPEYKAIQKELSRRPQPTEPVYKPVQTSKVKDEKGVDVEVRVGGYQPFSGGSQQTTDRYGKKGKPVPPEFI